jgi:3-hydroxyisobutyrate dehydrogenase/putative dehydrogenase
MIRVGWIGLGAMGLPMSQCVARAGHAVSAFDADPGRAALLADGVSVAGSSAAAASDASITVIMVATPAQVEATLFGSGGVAEVLQPGSVVMVMATVGPAAVEAWAERLEPRGVGLVDAPVSGGAARAAQGDLLVMVGGDDAAVQQARPLLDAMASTWRVVGPRPGDGQKLKMVNQLLCGVHTAVAAEALAYAEALGLDPRFAWEMVRHGAAASFMLDDRGARMVEGAYEPIVSVLDNFVKDMGLVNGAAREHAYPAPLAAAAEQLFLAGHRAGLGRKDDSALIEVLRGRAAAPQAGDAT